MLSAILRTRRGVIIVQLAVLVVILLIGQLVNLSGILPEIIAPSPIDVIANLISLLFTSTYWTAVGQTFSGALWGLLVAILVGVPIGMLTGRRRGIELSMRFLLDFGRAFPAIALLPVLVLVLGTTTQMKSVVVFTAVVFPIIIQAQHGARRLDPAIEETARSFRIPPHLVIAKVILPTAAPFIVTGIRLGATISVLVALGVGVLSGAAGVGNELVTAQQSGDSAVAFAYIITACLMGFGVNAIVGFAQSKLIRWHGTEGLED